MGNCSVGRVPKTSISKSRSCLDAAKWSKSKMWFCHKWIKKVSQRTTRKNSRADSMKSFLELVRPKDRKKKQKMHIAKPLILAVIPILGSFYHKLAFRVGTKVLIDQPINNSDIFNSYLNGNKKYKVKNSILSHINSVKKKRTLQASFSATTGLSVFIGIFFLIFFWVFV